MNVNYLRSLFEFVANLASGNAVESALAVEWMCEQGGDGRPVGCSVRGWRVFEPGKEEGANIAEQMIEGLKVTRYAVSVPSPMDPNQYGYAIDFPARTARRCPFPTVYQ